MSATFTREIEQRKPTISNIKAFLTTPKWM